MNTRAHLQAFSPVMGLQRHVDKCQTNVFTLGSSLTSRPSRFHPSVHRDITCAASSSSGRAAEVLNGRADPLKLNLTPATVVENKEASLDGSVRLLRLSIEDPKSFLTDGRKVKHIHDRPTQLWLDSYQTPGAFIAVRHCTSGGSLENCQEAEIAKHLFPITSSPYEARSSSAMLDASLVEILASRNSDSPAEKAIADLGPGALIEVSDVLGGGFNSLFNSMVNLQSALEEGRPLLMIAVGCSGLAPLRAALNWTPVQAHATAHAVSLYYVATSATNAAFLLDWDAWRDAGVRVHVIYSDDVKNGATPNIGEMLEGELFHREHGFVGALGSSNVTEASVLMAGVPGDVAGHLTRKLTHAGVASERLLFCDFF